MGKVIDLGLAKPDDPIYKGGPMISVVRSPKSIPATPPNTGGEKQQQPPQPNPPADSPSKP
jgi:hypothetical protein